LSATYFLCTFQVYKIFDKMRINISKVAPQAYDAMLELEKYLATSGLDKKLFELIKTRASQINGCAYCINMHVRDAQQIGETSQRLFLLDAWRETDLFTEKERAALALTEAITLITNGHVPDDVYHAAASKMTDPELAAVIMSIVTINAWNRIAITSRTPLD
jgi:AhpD family alkylhydroperoxidase